MAEFINYIIDSPIQPVKTNVLWVKKGVLHYYNKKWIPIAGGGSGNITYPIIDGEGNYSAVLAYSDNKALNISSIALGYNNISRNFAEASFGKYNLSHESDDPSIATLFSVGNGFKEERKNAFEIKENGDIYIGGRRESLQSILFNLENHPLNDKYAILEEQLQNLDVYTKENISILNSNIESNTSKIEENTTKININAIDIKSINDYLKELKNHIDVSEDKLESTFEKYKTDVDGALIEMSTSITQTAEEIRLEAEKTKKELDGKITEYEASFSITAEEIRAEVSRVETDVNGKIVEANSLISQTADAIRTEVSRVELDINGKITEANSRIEQTANSITSEVYEIEKTLDGKIEENRSSIEQTSEKIESTVESLTILDNKVLNQESKINQTAESIELLVTEVETQGSRIEENTANIEINKNAITSKVEKDDFDALSSAVEETGKEFTEVKQTVSGIETTIQDQTGKVTRLEETVTGLAVKTGTLEADIDSLKKQSDGVIDTHFGTEAPTLNNEPAVNWDTEELKKEHTGDLYYNNATGEAFRWSYDPETETYLWIELTDSALTDALEKISKLEVAIDGKVTIFYNEPSNYKEGDIWFVHNDNYYEFKFVKGQLLTAINANTIFSGEDWEDKTNFASHAEVETAANNLDTYIRGAFLDQTLTVAEVAQIKESKKTFDSLIAEVEESYKYLIVSAVAAEADKTKLEQAYNKLLSEETANEGSYILLVQAVNNLLALDKEEDDDIINLDEAETLLKAYEDAYNTFLTDLKAYYDATGALTENVQAYLNEASKYIENIVSDGILSPIEKKQLFDIWRQIKEEFIANRGIAVNYKIIKLNEEGNYVKNEELYNDKDYFDIYEAYLNNYLPLEGIFIGSDWGFNDLNVASPTPEGYNTEYIATSFNNYYNALTPFAEMVAEITIAITDAHDKAIALANKLQEHLDPKDEISVIGKGVILSSIIGVKKSDDDTFISAINAQALDNEDISTVDETHGRVVYAGGIPSTNNWNDSTTVIYEDGHAKFKSGEIAGDFHIGGNATIADSVSIGETRQAILNKANILQESLGVGGNTVIDGGLVLSTLLGVVDTEGNLKSVLNASDISKDTVTNHGRIVFAGGIENSEDWTTAKTIIYEDGYVHFKAGKIDDSVELGTAFIRSVAESEEIDVLSYPQNGTLVPLFQINKDSQGNIISLSVLYDFIANRNVIVHGDTSSTAKGSDSGTDGTLIGVIVNGTRYEDETNGMLDLSTLMNQYALTTEIPSLEGYATEQFVTDSITALNVGQYATKASLETLQTEVDNIESVLGMDEEAEGIINTWNEVKAFLAEIEVGDDLASILEGINTRIGNNTTAIGLIDGRVTVNEAAIADNATNIRNAKGEIDGLKDNKADWGTTLAHYGITDAYTKTEVANELAKYLLLESANQTIKGNITIEGNLIVKGDTSSTARGTDSGTDGTLIGVIVNGTRYEDETNGMLDLSTLMNQYALTTEIPSLDGYAKLTDIPSLEAYALKTEIPTTMAWTAITGKPSFASVATSGSYNDLSNKPTIPTTLPASDVYAWAKAATKPSYKTSEVAEETNLYFTNARAVSALADTLKDYVTKTALASDLGEYASKEWVNEQGYITGITLTGDDYISVNGYRLSLAIDAQGGLTNTGQGLGIYQIPSAKIVTDALGYTPLSTAGGTLTGALTISTNGWNNQIVLNGVDSNAGIQFKYSNTLMGSLYSAQNELYWLKGSNANKMWHAGNFNPANYLPLSGGTIRGSVIISGNAATNVPLNIATPSMGYTGYIRFGANFTTNELGLLGFSAKGVPAMVYEGAVNTLIHSGNYSSYALPLSGGTISGSTESPIVLNTSYADGCAINFRVKNLTKGWIGWIADNGVYLYNSYCGYRLGIKDDGTLYYASSSAYNTLYHTGNFNPADYLPLSGGTIDGTLSVSYRLKLTNGAALGFVDTSNVERLLTPMSWRNNALGWNDGSGVWEELIHSGNIGSYALKTDGSNEMVGRLYMQAHPVVWNVANGTYMFVPTDIFSTNKPELAYYNNGSWSRVAFLDSNVASATKLETTRSIWGQSFDGTGNVSGKLTSVTGIDFDTNVYGIRIDDYGNICFRTSASVEARDWSIKASNGTKLLLINNSGNVTIGASDLARTTRSLYVDGKATFLQANNCALIIEDGVDGNGGGGIAFYNNGWHRGTINASTLILNPVGNGNVLIGTTTDSGYKLDVNGTARISDAVTMSSRVSIGKEVAQQTAGRAQLSLVSTTDAPTDFILGPNALRWSITSRNSTDQYPYSLGIYDYAAAAYRMRITSAGDVYIYKNLVVSGDTSSGSDIRFKDKITDHRIALSDIADAPLFTFKWNDREDDSVHLGSSAQYWEKVTPWLVKGEDFKTLDYSTLGVAIGISLANKAVNHEERIKILEDKVKALEAENRRLRYGS